MTSAVWKTIGISALGAAGGFAYYYFVGCSSGTCPISSNPYVSTAYGALVGAVLSRGTSKSPQENP